MDPVFGDIGQREEGEERDACGIAMKVRVFSTQFHIGPSQASVSSAGTVCPCVPGSSPAGSVHE